MNNPWVRFLLLPVGLAGGVAAAHLVPGIDASDLERHVRDSLHVVGFAGVAWIIFELTPFDWPGKSLTAFFGAIALGVVAELGQQLAGFSFSEADIVRDAAGAGIVIVARILWLQGSTRTTRRIFRSLATVVFLAVFAPITYWSWGILGERLKAPMVMDFDGLYTSHLIRSTNSDLSLKSDHSVGGDAKNGFLEIMLSRAPRSGVLIETSLYDWRDYEWLVIDMQITSGSGSDVSIHINDRDSIGHYVDAPAGVLAVSRAAGSHRVPIREVIRQTGRGDDAGDVRQIALFARSRNRGAVLRIDNVRLE